MKLLPELAEQYVLQLRNGANERRELPNLAGFYRFYGFDGSDAERLKRECPDGFSSLCFILEDEALNSDISASVLSVYLKKRLGFETSEGSAVEHASDQLRLIFEHDILTDGE